LWTSQWQVSILVVVCCIVAPSIDLVLGVLQSSGFSVRYSVSRWLATLGMLDAFAIGGLASTGVMWGVGKSRNFAELQLEAGLWALAVFSLFGTIVAWTARFQTEVPAVMMRESEAVWPETRLLATCSQPIRKLVGEKDEVESLTPLFEVSLGSTVVVSGRTRPRWSLESRDWESVWVHFESASAAREAASAHRTIIQQVTVGTGIRRTAKWTLSSPHFPHGSSAVEVIGAGSPRCGSS